MSEAARLAKYHLYRKEALSDLGNKDGFVNVFTLGADIIAERNFCRITFSQRRLNHLFDYFWEDAKRILFLDSDEETEVLDHFKYAALMCFWTKKFMPVENIKNVTERRYYEHETVSPERQNELWSEFNKFADELVAFFLGFHLCNSYHLQVLAKGNEEIRKQLEARETRASIMCSYDVRPDLLHDILMILRGKNVSTFGIYLLYKSIFLQSVVTSSDKVIKLLR